MTIDEIRELLAQPQQLSGTQYSELEELVRLYPYCASLKFLYLQALSLRQDARYAGELKRLTVHLPDRGLLYRMVEGGAMPSVQARDKEEDGFALIEAFLSKEQTAGVDLPSDLTYTHSASEDYFACSTAHIASDDLTQPIQEPQPISAPTPTSVEIVAPAVHSAQDVEEELFTETLAKIYIKQGHYDKALRIISGLNLQYPDKSSYFAEQLRFLELLSSNDKAI